MYKLLNLPNQSQCNILVNECWQCVIYVFLIFLNIAQDLIKYEFSCVNLVLSSFSKSLKKCNKTTSMNQTRRPAFFDEEMLGGMLSAFNVLLRNVVYKLLLCNYFLLFFPALRILILLYSHFDMKESLFSYINRSSIWLLNSHCLFNLLYKGKFNLLARLYFLFNLVLWLYKEI